LPAGRYNVGVLGRVDRGVAVVLRRPRPGEPAASGNRTPARLGGETPASGRLKRLATRRGDMSTQTDRLEALGRELGDAIAQTPEYEAFEEAKAAVENDDEVQAKISEFHSLRDEFVFARQTGEATQEGLRKVQAAQQELHSEPVMAAYLDAQDELQTRLESVNEAVSEPLAVDFGGEAGGCCHD
jgi:cell fate (sporulation/competence/biofilm development) regulator YlbF (YheA/YmcA/DUF963 family)